MRITIMGGCFLVQHNIKQDRLYHQTLINLLKGEKGILPDLKLIRYERMQKIPEKFFKENNTVKTNILIFHLRSEPVMRLTKLYYRYQNDGGTESKSLNLPILNHVMSEKNDILGRIILSDRNYENDGADEIVESKWYHFMRECNYKTGALIGNFKYALKIYEKSLNVLWTYCQNEKIKFLVIGPAPRKFSNFENKITQKIELKFKKWAHFNKIPYLPIQNAKTKSGHPILFPNKIHITQEGHDEIANRIYAKLKTIGLHNVFTNQ